MKTMPQGVWHQLHEDEVLRLLEVDCQRGLMEDEVRRRQEKFGLNRLAPRRGTPGWRRFLRQFNQPLVALLLGAIAVTAVLGEWVDSSVICGVVIANAIVGFLQESKATSAIEALARLITSEATVVRGGVKARIPSDQLVPGDVVVLQPGDRVGADLRLFRVKDLQIDESALTGESVPVMKHRDPLALDTVLADRKNLAFAGTLVTRGSGEGVVWATGDKTETGRIAWLLAEAVEISTPLTKMIAQFSQLLLWGILLLAVVTFGLGVLRGEAAVDMFMAAVALAVGAIPEGLPAAVTIVLAIGVSRMAKRRAIIRQLPAVETLGSTTVICTDKTGTLTQNEMTVREIFAGGQEYAVSGAGHGIIGKILRESREVEMADHPALAECLRAGVLCNDAQFSRHGGQIRMQGDPTEIALLMAGEKGGLIHAETHRASPLVDAIPFGSEHMFRATLHERGGPMRVIYKVGAAERVLERCVDTLDRSGALAPLDHEEARRVIAAMAARGLRVLALARLHVASSHANIDHGQVAHGLTLLGLQGMMDPPRAEAVAAVRNCQEAGIAVKMITGDHLITARAIAVQVGLIRSDVLGEQRALTGRDLDNISDQALPEIAAVTNVFARVTPEQKIRLVRALQAQGQIVAMTGDGVNDAPALKQADIGVAMGISGTEVAKSAADMVLADDNFSSIEAAVEEGRGVFDNLTKFIVWIIPTNFGEALLLLAAIVSGLPLPVIPLQLLWINLTDTLLGLPLAFERKEADVMRRPPRDPRQPLLTAPLLWRTGLVTVVMLVGALWLFYWELGRAGGNLPVARTAVVNVIVLVETLYLFNCRSLTRACFSSGFFSNGWAFGGAFAMLGAQLAFTYAPLLNRLFHTAPLPAESWLRIGAVAASAFVLVELEKWLRFGRGPSAGRRPERQPRKNVAARSGGTVMAAQCDGTPRFSAELTTLVDRFDEHPVRFGALLEATQGRGYFLLLVLLALPFVTPIPLPGFSIPFGVVVAVLGVRLALGEKPWLPQVLLQRELPPRFLGRVLGAASRVVRLLEYVLRPRLVFVERHATFGRVAGWLIAVSGLFLILPLPLPFSNSLPAWTVLLLSAGTLGRDGLFFFAGCTSFALSVAFFTFVALAGGQALGLLQRFFLGS